MQGQFRKIISAPTFTDKHQTQVAYFLNIALLVIMGGSVCFLLILLITFNEVQQSFVILMTIGSSIVLKALLNIKRVQTVSILLLVLTWSIVTISATNSIGIYAPINSAYVIVIVLAGILFNPNMSLYATLICILTGLGLIYGMQIDFISTPIRPPIPAEIAWIAHAFSYSIIGILIFLTSRIVKQTLIQSNAITQELQRSSDNLRRAEALAQMGNFELDIQTEVIKWSDEVYTIFDIPIGTPMTLEKYTNLLSDSVQPEINQDIQSSVSSGDPYIAERRIILDNGNHKDLYMLVNPVKDKHGKVSKIFGIVQDITERKRAEQMQEVLLNISRSRYETDNLHTLLEYVFEELGKLLDVSNCYVALYDEKDNTYSFPYGFDQYDLDWSPQSLEKSLTDYVRRNGKSRLITEDDYKKLEEKEEIKLISKWSKIWLGAPLKLQQRVIGVIAVQDYENKDAYQQSDLDLLTYVAENIASVVDNKRAEHERLELQIQKQKTAFLQEFISHMTHDLKTPLSVIKNSTDLIKMVKDPLRQIEYVERINYQLERLDRMIEDILTISRLDHAQQSSYSLVDINTMLTHVTNQLHPKIQQKNLTLVLDLAPKLPYVMGIESDLTRAMLNLLENATNYTGKDGQITVRTYQATMSVVCEVQDTGIGIRPDDIDSIFERFYRADNARNFERGTGLGLAIVHRIIELHHGTIEVQSQLDIGTTFTIRLAKHTILEKSSA